MKLRMLKNLKNNKAAILNEFIENYFYMRKNLNQYLDENGIKRIFDSSKNNAYIKEINRSLISPKGSEGFIFRNSKLKKFKGKVYEDMKLFLLKNLNIKSINKIPLGLLDASMDLIEYGYVLSDSLKEDFYKLSKDLSELRFKAIEENRIKNISRLEIIKLKIKEITDLLLK